MIDSITIVSPPDDFLIDGKRILCYDLTHEQSFTFSTYLKENSFEESLIIYTCKAFEDIEWLLDKKHKSDIIIFNAESQDTYMIGYLSAQPNSFYFGNLKSLAKCNNREITDMEKIIFCLKKAI